MNKYKCDNHKLNLVCLDCVKACVNRYQRLLDFTIMCRYALSIEAVQKESNEILKEMDVLKEN